MTSLLRVIGYLLVLAVLSGVAVWLADHPGDASLEWQGWRIDTSVAVLAAGVAVVAAAAAALYRGWLFIRRMPRRVAQQRRENRRRRGYLALTRGMVAVAAGDAAEARRQVKRADGLLDDPPLTMLLSAQALQLAGDERAAEKFFAAMLTRPETEFLGVRGLLTQALKRGEHDRANELALRAYRLRPRSEWVASNLFDLQVKAAAWKDARDTLNRSARHRLIAAETRRARAVALDCQMAADAAARGDGGAALKLLRRAHDADPAFVPAAARLARLLAERGRRGRAAAVVERTWAVNPHPDLAGLYWRAREADDALGRVKAAQRLAKLNPAHAESHLAIAETALEARLWGEARHHLEMAAGAEPSARVCRRMAELEEAEHGDLAAARSWLLRATQADPDPAWVCGSCGNTVPEWMIACGNCGAFAGFAWRSPPHVMRLAGDGAADAGAPALAAPAAAPADTGARER